MTELVRHSFVSLQSLNIPKSECLGNISEQFIILPCVLDFARTLLEEDLLRVFWPVLVEHYSQCCANLYQLMGGPEAKVAYAVFAKEQDNAFWCLSTSLDQFRKATWDSRKSSPMKLREPEQSPVFFENPTETKMDAVLTLPSHKMSATALPFSTSFTTNSPAPAQKSSLFTFPSSTPLMTVFSTPTNSPVAGPIAVARFPSTPPRSVPLLTSSISTQEEISALVNLGIYLGLILSLEQQHEDGELALILGLEAAIRLGDKPGEARCHRNLATLYEQVGWDHPSCRGCLVMQSLGCPATVSHGRYDRALGHCNYALTLYRELNHRAGIGDVLQLQADLMRSRDIEAAKVCLTEALAIFEGPALVDSLGRAKVLQSLGDVQMQMETDYLKAKGFYSQAMDILQAHQDCDKILVVNLLTSLVEVHTRLGSYNQAHAMLKNAISLAQELDYRQGEGNLYCALAELLMCENNWDGAEKACDQARVLFEQIGDNQGEGRAQLQALSVHEGRKAGDRKSVV